MKRNCLLLSIMAAFIMGLPNSPFAQDPPTIILKMDDLRNSGSNAYNNGVWERFADSIKSYNINAGIGVVWEDVTEGPQDYLDLILDYHNSDTFEIWHHGWTHTRNDYAPDNNNPGEFEGTPYEYQKTLFEYAMDTAQTELGITLRTFGAPYNATDETFSQVISENPDMKVWLYCEDTSYDEMCLVRGSGNQLESSTGVVSYSSFETAYTSNTNDYLVLQGHPGRWDDTSFEEFDRVVDSLQAWGSTFMLPYDYYLQEVNNPLVYEQEFEEEGNLYINDINQVIASQTCCGELKLENNASDNLLQATPIVHNITYNGVENTVDIGDDVNVFVRVRAENAMDLRLDLSDGTNSTDGVSGKLTQSIPAGTSDWTLLEYQFTATMLDEQGVNKQRISEVRLFPDPTADGFSGAIYIDYISFGASLASSSSCLSDTDACDSSLPSGPYTYIVEEWNFTGGSTVSEDGLDVDFLSTGSTDDGSDDQLYIDRGDGFMSPETITEIDTGKLHLYVTMSGLNVEENPDNGGALRYFGVRLQNSGSIVIGARLLASYRDFAVDGTADEPALRLGGVSTTASTAGYPFDFHVKDNSFTYGLTLDYDGGASGTGAYKYWINSPDDDGSDWIQGPYSGAEADQVFDAINQIRFVMDHSGGTGDTPLPANHFNIDRIVLVHESPVAPTSATLLGASEDERVTISSNTTTTLSSRVQSLIIDEGSTFTVETGHEITVIDHVVINGSLVVKSGGAFKTFGEVTIGENGSFTKERTTTFGASAGQYSIVGAPVSDATTAALGGITYKYDEDSAEPALSDRFTLVSAEEAMSPGDGYFTANLGDASFSGTPNTGDIDVSLVYNAADGVDAGYNLVSNPYPTAIEFNSFVSSNPDITGTIYLWDDGGSTVQRTNSDYIVVAPSGVTAGAGRSGDFDGYIRSEQGFFVQASSAGTLHFDEVMRAGDHPNTDAGYFRRSGAIENVVRIHLSNETMTTNMALDFNAEATAGWDNKYDAKRFNSGSQLGIFSILPSDSKWQLAVQGMKKSELENELWIGVDIAEAGNYELTFEANEALSDLVLIDHQLGIVTSLAEQSVYAFYSEENRIAEQRFSLALAESANVLEVEELKEDLYRAYFTETDLMLLSRDGLQDAEVAVHNLQGKLLYHGEGITTTERAYLIPFQSNDRVLIVSVANAGSKETFKLIK